MSPPLSPLPFTQSQMLKSGISEVKMFLPCPKLKLGISEVNFFSPAQN
jgi:hypothetical protein